MPKVLNRLDKDPIFEATFEYRFSSAVPAAADIVQAVVFGALRDRFPRVSRNPAAEFASAFAQDPNFRYQPRLILQGESSGLYIGDRSVMVSCTAPYMGWGRLRSLIIDVLRLVKKADVVKETERISLRYINVLAGDDVAKQFSLVHFDATLGKEKYALNSLLTHVRTEIPKDGITCVVELTANATVKTESQQRQGLVLVIDTIYSAPQDFLQDPARHLEKVHDAEKSIFVDVLTAETLQSMGPTWETT